MSRLLLRLLRLLLQVIIFVLTEKWVELGGKEEPPPLAKAKKQAKQKRQAKPRKVFDLAAGRAVPRAPGRSTFDPLLTGDHDPRYAGEGGPRGPARPPPPRPGRAAPRTLSAALRDPRAIRQAMMVSVAFEPPASRRLLRRPR